MTPDDNNSKSKRIAKNTIVLYFRMFFLMGISLFTSRVVLQTLGVEDFGVYNVVGGFISMFFIFSNSLSNSISRFLTYELGKGDKSRLNAVFSTALNVQVAMGIVVFIIGEAVGLWFLYNKMNIPPERLDAAAWVLHCSLIAFFTGLISVPYYASIISHEKMAAFAYISIVEAIFKLGVVYLLLVIPFDNLKTYAVLILLISLLLRVIYGVYCKLNFSECTYHYIYDKKLLKEMSNFAGWGFFSNFFYVLNTQGVDVLINLFFGLTLNAARSIAMQVERAVTQFVTNFMTALNPQITKSYAAGEMDYFRMLICWGSKASYFLMLFFAIPICLEAPKILHLWLGIVPDYTVVFVRLTLIASMTTILGNTLVTAIQATGNIRNYQIVVSIWGALSFPMTWLAFKMGASPTWAYIIYFVIYFVLLFIRMPLTKHLIKPSVYFKEVLLKVFFVTACAVALPILLCYIQAESLLRLVETCALSAFCTCLSVYFLGLKANERKRIRAFVLNKLPVLSKSV